MIKLTDTKMIMQAKSDTKLLGQLLADNLDFIRFAVWKCMKPLMQGDSYYDVDDMFQEGCVAFIEAVHGFNPKRASFTTYAAAMIRWRLLTWMRKNRRGGLVMTRRELDEGTSIPVESLDKVVLSNEEDGVSLLDTIGKDYEEEYLSRAHLAMKSANLSEQDKQIFILRYLGYSQSEIAREVGLSQVTVSRRLQRVHQVITA